MKRLAVLALALSVVLTACGSSKKGSSAQGTDGKKSTDTTIAYQWPPVTVTGSTKDKVAALNTVLQVTDLPAGWNSSGKPTTAQPNSLSIDETFIQCMFGPSPSTLSVYYASPVMVNADGSQVAQSFTRVVGSKADAQKDFSTFTAQRASSCQQAMYYLQKNLNDIPGLTGKKFGKAPPDAIPADTIPPTSNTNDVIGIRVLVSPRDAKTTYMDIFAYGNKRYETVLVFQSSTANSDQNMERGAINSLKLRVQKSAS